jgi:hypothetical protein
MQPHVPRLRTEYGWKVAEVARHASAQLANVCLSADIRFIVFWPARQKAKAKGKGKGKRQR